MPSVYDKRTISSNLKSLKACVFLICFLASQMTAAGSLGQYMSKMNKSPAKWINESTWKECLQLSACIPAFAGLCSNIAVNGAFWSKFAASENPLKFLENEQVLQNERATPTDGMLCCDSCVTPF